MKKIVVTLLAGVMALGLVACGGSSDSTAESKVPANTYFYPAKSCSKLDKNTSVFSLRFLNSNTRKLKQRFSKLKQRKKKMNSRFSKSKSRNRFV